MDPIAAGFSLGFFSRAQSHGYERFRAFAKRIPFFCSAACPPCRRVFCRPWGTSNRESARRVRSAFCLRPPLLGPINRSCREINARADTPASWLEPLSSRAIIELERINPIRGSEGPARRAVRANTRVYRTPVSSSSSETTLVRTSLNDQSRRMRSGKSSARTALRLHSGILRLLGWYPRAMPHRLDSSTVNWLFRDFSLLNFASSCESFFFYIPFRSFTTVCECSTISFAFWILDFDFVARSEFWNSRYSAILQYYFYIYNSLRYFNLLKIVSEKNCREIWSLD